ncbi:MAG: class I SAM-dependent methyltransferase [Bacteroidales bacterium]|nr:class I SAM-dependent methyltransferase [Bacteroidales bacterium]
MINNVKRIRKLKYYFFKLGVHKILPGKILTFLGNLATLSKWISTQKDVKYSNFPNKNFIYNKRFELYKFILEKEISGAEIDYLEFGVAKGTSFTWWIENIRHKNSRFYGFDTFDGLPEDWGPFKKGDMSNENEPPKINDSRHKFYQGIFQKTLYEFLKSYKSDKRKVIHMDADLYTATLFVLTTLSPYLNKGDILLFDEFNVPLHEYKAFSEWTESFYINYSVLGEVNNFYQVAIKIE